MLVARRPSTMYVITIVVENNARDYSVKIAYPPVILYGCLPQISVQCWGSYCNPSNVFKHLGCGILSKDVPFIYFPVAVVLIAGLVFATACHLCVWPRKYIL